MKGDFTRDSFERSDNFNRVLLQQGRPGVDADWNEQISILLRRFEMLAYDAFGDHGGPEAECGFAVFFDKKSGENALGRGRYYVHGMACENHEIVKLPRLETDESDALPAAAIVYLDVCEEYLAATQRPEIADIALGGLDTAGRSRIAWTPRYWRIDHGDESDLKLSSADWVSAWELALESIDPPDRTPLMRARTSPQFGYSGTRNQLYRVEVHEGGAAGEGATWKWSRENGSVAFAVESIAGHTLELTRGSQAVAAFRAGDWVEVTNETNRENDRSKPALHRVVKADVRGASIDLDSATAPFESGRRTIVRRWDQREGGDGANLDASGGVLPLIENQWLPVEAGIEVSFCSADKNRPATYTGGDYWLVPARIDDRGIDWPKKHRESGGLPPKGVVHRYAPLAGLVRNSGNLKPEFDFRIRRKPLAPA